MELVFSTVMPDELRLCMVGSKIKLWSRADLDSINAYRPGAIGGQGKVAVLSKAENAELAMIIDSGRKVWLAVTSVEGTKYKFDVCAD